MHVALSTRACRHRHEARAGIVGESRSCREPRLRAAHFVHSPLPRSYQCDAWEKNARERQRQPFFSCCLDTAHCVIMSCPTFDQISFGPSRGGATAFSFRRTSEHAAKAFAVVHLMLALSASFPLRRLLTMETGLSVRNTSTSACDRRACCVVRLSIEG